MAQGIREQRLRAALHSAGLDLLVCLFPEHVLLLCGYWPMNGMSFAMDEGIPEAKAWRQRQSLGR